MGRLIGNVSGHGLFVSGPLCKGSRVAIVHKVDRAGSWNNETMDATIGRKGLVVFIHKANGPSANVSVMVDGPSTDYDIQRDHPPRHDWWYERDALELLA